MKYPNAVMSRSQLMEMGFKRTFLDKAFNHPKQTFAWRNDPNNINSTIEFDTEGFEKWRVGQIRLAQMGREG